MSAHTRFNVSPKRGSSSRPNPCLRLPSRWHRVHAQLAAAVPTFTIYGACVYFAVCVFYTVVEKDDPLARGLYIPCPDHYKNYCVHGDCQFPNILAQPSCRYTHTHKHRNAGKCVLNLFSIFWNSKPTSRAETSPTRSPVSQGFLSRWGENRCYLSYKVDNSFPVFAWSPSCEKSSIHQVRLKFKFTTCEGRSKFPGSVLVRKYPTMHFTSAGDRNRVESMYFKVQTCKNVLQMVMRQWLCTRSLGDSAYPLGQKTPLETRWIDKPDLKQTATKQRER